MSNLTLAQMINPNNLSDEDIQNFIKTNFANYPEPAIQAIIYEFLFRIPYSSLPKLIFRLKGLFNRYFPVLLSFALEIERLTAMEFLIQSSTTETETVQFNEKLSSNTTMNENRNHLQGVSYNPVDTNWTLTVPQASTSATNPQGLANATAGNSNHDQQQATTRNNEHEITRKHFNYSNLNTTKINAQRILEPVLYATNALFVQFEIQDVGGDLWM